ncbi:HAMP domain-containing protein [Leptolyngbya sp. FACHB-321]|uniref:cache domain-containing protein n=1 Tax=Leptolyngbya sp. FACHB-321 TaxID=2692807 RepID=UPI001689E192|nr:cache domain-containing protein [Leptolyngbya sp. FACHB-321]MBD2036189.1 HAMP domain-containing protein [Leptolyngbya sp. FACHB-321]
MRLQEPLPPASQPRLRVPLRAVLIIPFILQISIAVGLTAFFSLRNGQKAVNDVASQLRNEVTARISQHLADYVAKPQLVTQINANAAQFGTLDLQNAASLERHFWQQMHIFNATQPIAFGSEQGTIHSIDRMRDGSLVIRVIDASTNGKYHTYSIDQQGNRDRLLKVNTTFDPRTRPWYVEAVQAKQPTWTNVYPYFSSLGLAISATRPVYNERGQLLGVTNATLSLVELGNFLSNLKIGRSGQTFIVDRSGNLIASSTSEQPFRSRRAGGEEKRERIPAIASRDPVTRQTAQYLEHYFGNFSNIRASQQLAYTINQQQYLIQVAPFSDRYGLDWLIVVGVPEADFMEHIEANTRTTILLCLMALVVSTLMGILTSQCIARPIARVIAAAQEISHGKLNQTITARNIEELDSLTQAFNQMSMQLQASFAALETANEELEVRVEQRTAELQERSLQLKQAFDFEATLKRITDRVRDTLDESQILQTVMQELTAVLRVECCSTAIYDLEQNVLNITYEYAKPTWAASRGQRISLDTDPFGIHQSLMRGQDLQLCQLFPNFGRSRASILACPIFDEQSILADIWLFQQSDHIYSDLEIRLVQQVTNQCAIAMRQARLYQAAQSQVEELQKLHRLKDDFLSTVSHELRTPVSNMKLAIYMLRLAPDLERQQKYLNILETECKREVDLINDLLDLQRLEASAQSITLQPIDLQEWLPPIIQSFQSRLHDRQQAFTLNLPPTTHILHSSPDNLGRLLAELLNNACKYTPSHGEICFTLHQDLDASHADEPPSLITQFEVRNQAEIPQAEISHIFEKFYRIPNSDLWNQGGTGLGLALVKKLVEQLEGEITVNSEDGWTTFKVSLRSALL